MQDINYKQLELQSKYYNLLHTYVINNYYNHKLLISEFIKNNLINLDNELIYDTKYQLIHKNNTYLIAYCVKLGLVILDNNLETVTNIFKSNKELSESYLNFIKD